MAPDNPNDLYLRWAAEREPIDDDAYVLRRAAVILRRESRRPESLLLAAVCRTLNNVADRLNA